MAKITWTEELKTDLTDKYLEQMEVLETDEQKAQGSAGIVEGLAEELDTSINSVRMILMKAGVYVKKAPAVKAAAASGKEGKTGTGGKRVNKAESIAALKSRFPEDSLPALEEAGIDKMTGKMAAALDVVIVALLAEGE